MKSKPSIKYCGMRRAEDIRYAVELGVDAIGIIMVPNTPRSVDLDTAVRLRKLVPPHIAFVPVVKNMAHGQIDKLIQKLSPNFIQFHGNEPVEVCEAFGMPYIKAISVSEQSDIQNALKAYSNAACILFDAKSGGQGIAFDWSLFPDTSSKNDERLYGLAGGINQFTLKDALKARPDVIDLSSGIEDLYNPVKGQKCPVQMKKVFEIFHQSYQ